MSINIEPGAVGRGKFPTAWVVGSGLGLASLVAVAAIVLRPGQAPEPAVPAATLPTAAAEAPRAESKPLAPPPAVRPSARQSRPANAEAGRAQASVVCAHCGVVESVVAVKRKGEATGLGVVAGGVLGAVVGHQMGNGNGKKAMTVIGAVGGGVAGNEVEKRARGDTVYQVRVRMDDNSERTIEQASAPHVGARVEVQGNTIKALRTAG